MPKQATYPVLMRLVHWIMVLVIFGALGTSMLMDHVKAETLDSFIIQAHVAFGYLTILFVAFRLIIRFLSKLPEGVGSEWEIKAAHWGHIALYGLMVLTPLMGILVFQFNGWTVSVFGAMPLPDMFSGLGSLGWIPKEIHELLGNLFYAVIAAHIAAVFYHEKLWDEPVMHRISFKKASDNA